MHVQIYIYIYIYAFQCVYICTYLSTKNPSSVAYVDIVREGITLHCHGERVIPADLV